MNMSTSRAAKILAEAMELPPEERATLGAKLLESVEETQDVVDAAWREEIGRRIAEVEAGEVELESWDEVRRQAAVVLRRE